MNQPLPRSSFGKKFADNYDRIFGKSDWERAYDQAEVGINRLAELAAEQEATEEILGEPCPSSK